MEGKQFGTLTSGYWRVLVLATHEEQVFSTLWQCEEWIDKVKYTFNDRCMKFKVTQVQEWSATI